MFPVRSSPDPPIFKKLQSDPVLIRPKLASDLNSVRSSPVRAYLCYLATLLWSNGAVELLSWQHSFYTENRCAQFPNGNFLKVIYNCFLNLFKNISTFLIWIIMNILLLQRKFQYFAATWLFRFDDVKYWLARCLKTKKPFHWLELGSCITTNLIRWWTTSRMNVVSDMCIEC